ncbi:MAG TPA: hypothetical protein VI299_21405 [Polyangiales bacterium]
MQASWLVTIGMGALAVIVASGFVLLYSLAVERLGGRRIVARMSARTAVLGWMAVFAALAESGTLARFDAKPPPLALMMIAVLAMGIGLGYSKVGDTFVRGLPLGWLVLAQGFRVPLEVVMHRAALQGLMPVEMSYSGYNFDILTGIGALVVGTLVQKGKASRALLYAWNVIGSLLLANVLVVALLASPLVRFFGDDPAHVNSWIATFPFVWLPAVLVVAAVFGHVVIFRALRAGPASSQPSS